MIGPQFAFKLHNIVLVSLPDWLQVLSSLEDEPQLKKID